MTNDDAFHLQMRVREYECDSAGIVNNSVYLNYLEYARYEFLRQHLNMDIPSITEQGLGFVLLRVEIDYRRSLRPGDEFIVRTTMQRESQKRFLFVQDIYFSRDNKLASSAKTLTTGINMKTGKSEIPEFFEALLGEKYAPPLPEAAGS